MVEEIEFVEKDLIGEENLDVISEADRFNEYMYSAIKPFCKGNILEIGSGIGNISGQLINDGFKLMLSDVRGGYCNRLNEKFQNNKLFLGTEVIDIIDPEFDVKYSLHFGKYDTVFSLNVVEHIKDDSLAISNCKKFLKDGGALIILVPAYKWLYNKFDSELGHYRRYTKKQLSSVFENADLNIIHKQYFNFAGIVGWFLSGTILKKKTIPEGQMRLFDIFIPLVKFIDKIICYRIGLSVLMIGNKYD